MACYFKNTKKDIIMTVEDEEDFGNNNVCRFCDKNNECGKVRYHCHLTDNHRGTEDQLIVFVLLMLLKIKVILFHSYFIVLVTMIVKCFLKSKLIKRMIK